MTGTSPLRRGTAPKLIGSAPAGTTVELYTNPSCAESATASASASQFAALGISVTVPSESTTTFYALA